MLCRIEGKRTAHRDHYYACWAPSGAGPSRSSNVLSDDRAGRIDSPMACGSWFAHGISTRVVQIFEPVWSNHQVFSLTPREPRVSEYFLRDRVRGDAGRVAAERGKDPRDSAIAAVVRAI